MLVMEQARLGKKHKHAVIVAGVNDLLIAQGASRLHNIIDTVMRGTINIVTERNIAVRTKCNALQTFEPFLLLLWGQALRHVLKVLLPCLLFGWRQIITQVTINCVSPVRSLHSWSPGQVQDGRVLAQIPVLGLCRSQAHAMDARLLACSIADALPIKGHTNRVGLYVFERDQRDKHILACVFGYMLFSSWDVFYRLIPWNERIALLLERRPKDLSRFHCYRFIVRVDLDHYIFPLLLPAQDRRCLWFVAWSNDAIRYFSTQEPRSGNIHRVAESGPIAKRTQAISSSGAGISYSERRKF